MHVTLTAVDKGLTSRVGASRAGRIIAVIEGHLTGLYQHNCWSVVGVPTTVPAGCNDDLLHHGFPCVFNINNFLMLPLNLESDIGRIHKTCPDENRCHQDSRRRRKDSREGYSRNRQDTDGNE